MKQILISSGILILVIAALRVLVRKKVSQRLLYAMWLLVALRLLLPFELGQSQYSLSALTDRLASGSVALQQVRQTLSEPITGPSKAELYQQLVQDYIAQGTDPAAPVIQEQIRLQVDERVTAPSLSQVLRILWFGGTLLMGIWFICVNVCYQRRAKIGSEPFRNADSPIAVRISPNVPTPCLTGLFRPVIYLPPESTASDQTLRHVLTHELSHLRHWDHIWSFVRCLCLCVYWFDPLVWLAAILSKRDCELACDEAALKHLGPDQRIPYGKTLLATVSHASSPAHILETATAMNETKKQLKERVNFIVKRPKMLLAATLSLILTVSITAGCAFTGKQQALPATEPATTATDPTQQTTPETRPTAPATGQTGPTQQTNPSTEPSGDVTGPTELLPPDPPDSTLVPCPNDPRLEDLVITHWDAQGIRIPRILPISRDAVSCSLQIYEKALYAKDQDYIRSLSYKAWFDGQILSVLLIQEHRDDTLFQEAYNLDTVTGEALTTADMAKRYLNLSYPGLLSSVNALRLRQAQDQLTGEALQEASADIPINTMIMKKCSLLIGDGGRLTLSYADPVGYYNHRKTMEICVPCAISNPMGETESYEWLFGLHYQTDGAYATSYALMLIDTVFYEPDAFISHLSRLHQDEVISLAALMAYEMDQDTQTAYRTLLEYMLSDPNRPEAEHSALRILLKAPIPSISPTVPTGTPCDQEELAQIQALFENRWSWCSRAAGVYFTDPRHMDLGQLFRCGFPEADEILTREEINFLKSTPLGEFISYVDRVTDKQMDQVLRQYFGIPLEETDRKGLDRFVYFGQTDCRYTTWFIYDHTPITVHSAYAREDGCVDVYYSHHSGLADEPECVMTLRFSADQYTIVSNQFA